MLLLLATMSLAAACYDEDDYLQKLLEKSQPEGGNALQVTNIRFYDDYKHFSVDTRLAASIGSLSLSDPSEVRVEAVEYDYLGRPQFAASQPVLDRVVSTGAEQIRSANLKALVLVDLTIPQALVDKEREAVKEMSTLFSDDNLYVSFITSDLGESSIMAPSEYVLDNYFRSDRTERKSFFSAVSNSLNLLADGEGIFRDASERILVVLSDGKLFYDDSFSVESDYFTLKQDLLAKSLDTEESHIMYYVDMKADDSSPDEAESFMQTLCSNTGGRSFESFDWVAFEEDIFARLNINYSDYRFEFTNPDRKQYSGFSKTLKILCFHDGESIAEGSTEIKLGNYFSPIVVNPDPDSLVISKSLTYIVYLLAFVLLILLFAIPHIKYFVFKRRCVVSYTDANMVVSGNIVGDSCYYCKAPFKEGEKVVVKCAHAMHESCWEENGYHCPEYGRNCAHGSHYFNRKNLFDLKNAPYYSKWIITAILAAVISWVIYMVSYDSLGHHFLSKYVAKFGGELDNPFFIPPMFGYLTVAVATFGFSWITTRKRCFGERILEMLLRSQIAAVLSYLAFWGVAMVIVSTGWTDNSVLIDIIPWAISGLLIAAGSTIRTDYVIKDRAYVLILLTSAGVMLLWSVIAFALSIDYKPLLLILFLIFALGLAAGMAQAEPRSHRCFLHTSGAVKEMDIALYKWFASNPKAVVSIGKSVDCSIDMTWDPSPKTGPEAAQIKQLSGRYYLYALDGNVRYGKRTLKSGKRVRLYKGKSFTIGETTFTYQV